MPDSKTCPRCDREKPVEEFAPRANRPQGQRDAYCRPCRTAIGAEWRAKNLERARAINREGKRREYARSDKLKLRLRNRNGYQTKRPCVDCGATVYREHERSAIRERCPQCWIANEKERERERGQRRRHCVTHADCETCGVRFALPPTRKNGAIARFCDSCNKAREINRWHIRRAKTRKRLVPTAVIRELREAQKCELCGCQMTRGKGPRQVNIDHIIPVNIGGAHHPTNLRAICRTCNFKRPKDGSDVISAITATEKTLVVDGYSFPTVSASYVIAERALEAAAHSSIGEHFVNL